MRGVSSASTSGSDPAAAFTPRSRGAAPTAPASPGWRRIAARTCTVVGLGAAAWLAGSLGATASADTLGSLGSGVAEIAGDVTAPVVSLAEPVVVAVAAPVQAVATPVAQAATPVAQAAAPVVQAAAPVVSAVAPVVAPVVQAAVPVVSVAAPVVVPVVAPVVPVVAPVVQAADPVVSVVAPVVAPVVQAAAPVVAVVTPVVAPVVEAVAPVAEAAAPVTGVVEQVISPVEPGVTPALPTVPADVLPVPAPAVDGDLAPTALTSLTAAATAVHDSVHATTGLAGPTAILEPQWTGDAASVSTGGGSSSSVPAFLTGGSTPGGPVLTPPTTDVPAIDPSGVVPAPSAGAGDRPVPTLSHRGNELPVAPAPLPAPAAPAQLGSSSAAASASDQGHSLVAVPGDSAARQLLKLLAALAMSDDAALGAPADEPGNSPD